MRKLVEFQILDINADYYGLDFFELIIVFPGVFKAASIKQDFTWALPIFS